MEAAEITLSPSHVEQFKWRRTEIVSISHEFKTGSVAWSPMEWNLKELQTCLSLRYDSR